MKMLNLDALTPVLKKVVFNGKEYEVKEPGVGAFLEAAAEAEKLTSKDDVVANLESTIRQIRRVIPSLPESELREMTFDHLFTLVRFVNGTLDDLKEVGDQVAQKQGDASGN